jgi:radical SAM protein with 4Fe4S-binding SPASM domain
MTEEEFTSLLPKLRPWSDYLYFHLMGEPLLHPLLGRFLDLAGQAGFKVILTTNGTLLPQCRELLLNALGLHKINISLHAFEANDLAVPFEEYLDGCFAFGKAAEGKLLTVYRLWNHGGADTQNSRILSTMEQFFPKPWVTERRGTRIGNKVYLEYGDKFDWPDLSEKDYGAQCFCYGLRDQIGILCDGTVVPCCLDHEGDIPLGNLHRQDLEAILQSDAARKLYEGFSNRQAIMDLCRRCGYARRFQ